MTGSFPSQPKRALAIDPASKGFGFAVLEGPDALVDWGLKDAGTGTLRNRKCLERAAELIAQYEPEVLIVERTAVKGCRRRPRVRRLIKSLLMLARRHRLLVRQVSRTSVLRTLSPSGGETKYQVAIALAERFPELAPHLPPVRRNNGDGEDPRMAIFDAVAFGWMFFEPLRKERHALTLIEKIEKTVPYSSV